MSCKEAIFSGYEEAIAVFSVLFRHIQSGTKNMGSAASECTVVVKYENKCNFGTSYSQG